MLSLYLPYPKTRQIMRIRDRIKPDAELYEAEQKKLLKRYALLDPYGNPKSKNNRACFDSEENKNKFIDEMTKLRETPLDFCADVISVTEAEIGSQLISGEDIENLTGFIQFVDDSAGT